MAIHAVLFDVTHEEILAAFPDSRIIIHPDLSLADNLLTAADAAEETHYFLSGREKEILKWLVEGRSYKMIAHECCISIQTVKSHIRNVYRKLQVASMTEAVTKAFREKLV